ncbi:MAG TPA: PAS domain-containing protein, partial [Sphingomicrobium sp.]|nr:PAS domain-containing protein [Sphingomicrobium sp.]
MLDRAIDVRRVIDALDEPTIIVDGRRIELANAAAREVLGQQIEGRDVRLAIRHPQALDFILAHRSGEIDVTGIGELGRAWRLVIKTIGGSVMVRMVDRSAAVS